MAGPQTACCPEICCKLTRRTVRKAQIFSKLKIIVVIYWFSCMCIRQKWSFVFTQRSAEAMRRNWCRLQRFIVLLYEGLRRIELMYLVGAIMRICKSSRVYDTHVTIFSPKVQDKDSPRSIFFLHLITALSMAGVWIRRRNRFPRRIHLYLQHFHTYAHMYYIR